MADEPTSKDAEALASFLTEEQRERLRSKTGSWSERDQKGFPAELFGPSWQGFRHLSSLGKAVRGRC